MSIRNSHLAYVIKETEESFRVLFSSVTQWCLDVWAREYGSDKLCGLRGDTTSCPHSWTMNWLQRLLWWSWSDLAFLSVLFSVANGRDCHAHLLLTLSWTKALWFFPAESAPPWLSLACHPSSLAMISISPLFKVHSTAINYSIHLDMGAPSG